MARKMSAVLSAKPNSRAPLGSGGRFAALQQKLMREGKSPDSARAIAASIGRKKYGSKRMAGWAAKGR